MILWKPRTEVEEKLFELYAADEDDTRDQVLNRDTKGKKSSQEFNKTGGKQEDEV